MLIREQVWMDGGSSSGHPTQHKGLKMWEQQSRVDHLECHRNKDLWCFLLQSRRCTHHNGHPCNCYRPGTQIYIQGFTFSQTSTETLVENFSHSRTSDGAFIVVFLFFLHPFLSRYVPHLLLLLLPLYFDFSCCSWRDDLVDLHQEVEILPCDARGGLQLN